MDFNPPACDDLFPLCCYLCCLCARSSWAPPSGSHHHAEGFPHQPAALQRGHHPLSPLWLPRVPGCVLPSALRESGIQSVGGCSATPEQFLIICPTDCQLAPQYQQQTVIKPQSVVFTLLLCLCLVFYLFFFYCASQFQSAANTRDAQTNRGQQIDGKKSGQSQRSSIVLPVYLTEDNLTLAVLSLLLGGWLVVVVTFPIVSCCSCWSKTPIHAFEVKPLLT